MDFKVTNRLFGTGTGARLRWTREAYGRTRDMPKLSMQGFATLLGIRQNTWHNYESGARPLPVDVAVLVCQRTGVSLDWLYRGRLDLLPPPLVDALLAVMPADATERRGY